MTKAFDTFRIKATLTGELSALEDLAYNLRWSWHPETIDLFRRLDPDLWNETRHNPVKMLGLISQEKLSQAASDDAFVALLNRVYKNLVEYISGSAWFGAKYGVHESPQIAYFSMEYGLTECMPIYSGGLGILAGDHLKSASDLGLPLVGVGLLYQQGYFQQYLNADGWQQERYPYNDFYNLPLWLEIDQDGRPVLAEIQFPGRAVYCRIWGAQVGRVPLYLLDTNTPENNDADRKITYQLYGGDTEDRIKQEIVLGIGGMRALRKMGYHVKVCHMNEGHAGFLSFERIRHRKQKDNLSIKEAMQVVKAGTVFTTHTPVPAGIDEFQPAMIEKYLGYYLDQAGIGLSEFLALGRHNPDDLHEPFNMALYALRTSAGANGVSKLHGEVSRKMWSGIWSRISVDEIPIEHITNGIHISSWISHEMSELYDRYLGPNWATDPSNKNTWKRVEKIPDVELWRIHERRRERLIAFTRRKLMEQLRRRGASAWEVESARETLNPEALTIGFARRFATYKRATLLLRDKDRLRKILAGTERPVQFIFAGKAHPRDNGGKELIKELVHFARSHDIRNHFVFLENYDINVARYLVQGVDVWLNTPRRPHEASGTSGMKVLPNGGLNLSVLDGWWCEGYDSRTGWAIGAGENYDDPNYQDEIESKALFDVLENDVIPLFYDYSSNALPRKWISVVKNSIMQLCPVFCTDRMVKEYTEKFYMNAHNNWNRLSENEFARTRELAGWKRYILKHWHNVEIVSATLQQKEADVGFALKVYAEVNLGGLKPQDVLVQTCSGPLDADYNITGGNSYDMKYTEQSSGNLCRYEGFIPCDESGLYGYSIRILPRHNELIDHFDLELARWIGDKRSAGEKTKTRQFIAESR
ncbi:MAG: alpha-glucan family phosphorylase [Candidatus Zixiibacteriota bacterium]|nr:MAG: alpha-glucan family phosphorylase [candidate division Zixibacteria bacterium]